MAFLAAVMAWNAMGASPEIRDVIRRDAPDLQNIRITAIPARVVVVGRSYTIEVSAEIPKELESHYPMLANVHSSKLASGEKTTLGAWPDFLTFHGPSALGIDAASCQFGVRQSAHSYELYWDCDAKATSVGLMPLSATLVAGASTNQVTVDVVPDRIASVTRFLLDTIPILFVVLAIVMLLADGDVLLAAIGILWSILWWQFAPLHFPGRYVVLIRALAIIVAVAAFSIRRFRRGRQTPSEISIDTLHRRAERLSTDALNRARWQLSLGIGCACIAFFIALVPMSQELTDNPQETVAQVLLTGAPYLLVFVILMLASRFFFQQHRHCMEDYRYFEQGLRDREWQQLLLSLPAEQITTLKELKELLGGRDKSERGRAGDGNAN